MRWKNNEGWHRRVCLNEQKKKKKIIFTVSVTGTLGTRIVIFLAVKTGEDSWNAIYTHESPYCKKPFSLVLVILTPDLLFSSLFPFALYTLKIFRRSSQWERDPHPDAQLRARMLQSFFDLLLVDIPIDSVWTDGRTSVSISRSGKMAR